MDVVLVLDDEPRTVTVPADLAAALGEGPDLRGAFDGLSYSGQRRSVLAIDGARTPQTRQRRIAKVVDELGRRNSSRGGRIELRQSSARR